MPGTVSPEADIRNDREASLLACDPLRSSQTQQHEKPKQIRAKQQEPTVSRNILWNLCRGVLPDLVAGSSIAEKTQRARLALILHPYSHRSPNLSCGDARDTKRIAKPQDHNYRCSGQRFLKSYRNLVVPTPLTFCSSLTLRS